MQHFHVVLRLLQPRQELEEVVVEVVVEVVEVAAALELEALTHLELRVPAVTECRQEGGEMELQLEYWRQTLEGLPPLLELPTDRPRPAVQTHRGAVHRFEIPADLAEALRLVGRRSGATMPSSAFSS